jgi:hypothetical protein
MSLDRIEQKAKSKAEADMRLLAKRASLVALLAIVVLFVSLLTAFNLLPLIEPFIRGATTADAELFWATMITGIHRLVPVIPFAFYLLAVLGALRILDRISEGEYFSSGNIGGIGEIGGSMLWGAGWAAFVVPALSDWTAGIGGYRVDFRPETLVIATIGLCLLVLGRLLVRAQQLEAEIEGIV